MNDYSQNGESIILHKLINENTPKVIFEVGALDGLTNSNSRLFTELGWKTYLFEPNPISYKKLLDNTSHFDNLESYNIGISDKEQNMKFNIVKKKNFEGHSSINKNGKTVIKCLPLDHFVDGIDIGIMTIDCEGHDNIILADMIKKRILPKLLMVESNTKQLQDEQYNILHKDYEIIQKISVNTIWKLKS